MRLRIVLLFINAQDNPIGLSCAERIPNFSWTTFATGARQFVVHEAFEMILCAFGSYCSSLTPRTIRSDCPARNEYQTFHGPPSPPGRDSSSYTRRLK